MPWWNWRMTNWMKKNPSVAPVAALEAALLDLG
jgi:hypothetical protein